MSSLDYLDLCRLCLVKDRVSVPIFEGEGDVRQIFLKITACLPVKVNREDKLPKKICDNCVYKIELCYQFWHTTANAEKQLLQWLGEVNMEDKQGYNVLNPNGMKPSEQSNENRLDGTVMQQVSEHQNNMNMGMMDNMGLSMPMMMSSNAQQQITSVPMDTSGSSVQNVQPVAGPSTQTTHDQIAQNQTDAPTQQEEEDESSEEDENSDDECDGDEGLPIKEESEEDPNNSRTIEPTTFVNVSLACDEAGPSGLQQQKIPDMPEIVMPQTADVDPKTGFFEVGELIGQGIKIERSEEEFVEYNHTQIEIDSTVEDLVIKQEEVFNAAYSENFKNTSFNSEKSKQRRSECARLIGRGIKIERSEEESEEYNHTQIEIDSTVEDLVIKEEKPFNAAYSENLKNTLINAEKRIENRGKHARYKRMYKLHMVKHSDERPYKCLVCEKSFKSKDSMNHHMQTVHTGVTYTCDLCGLISRNINSFRIHVRRHKCDFRHRCEQCGKGFITKHEFEDHKTIKHLGIKTFVCYYCGNAYSRKSNLIAHMRAIHIKRRVHKTPKQHQCDRCDKSFVSELNLRDHTCPQMFLCVQCGKNFASSRALKVHQRQHTGERPYQCELCPKAFPRTQSLKAHKRVHTGDRYKCDICEKTFTQPQSLKRHLRNIHLLLLT